ncbi:MAG: ribosome biogenesis GTP-binding protein YihA/YsxC [Acidobacteriota bacterium]
MKIDSAEHVRAAHDEARFLRDDRPQIAFVGRSNVGKSSLMNRLLGRKKLARTSGRPGRTRAVHYYLVDRRFYFVDLPGYGYAKVPESERRSWAELVDRYFRRAPSHPLVVLIVDAKVGATELDVEALKYLASLATPVVVAATKVDRLPRGKRAARRAEIGRRLGITDRSRIIPVSARTGEGIKDLWKEINSFLRAGPPGFERPPHEEHDDG